MNEGNKKRKRGANEQLMKKNEAFLKHTCGTHEHDAKKRLLEKIYNVLLFSGICESDRA